MQFIRSYNHCLSLEVQNALRERSFIGATIGNFDGMHLGHQELVTALVNRCKDAPKHSATVLLTFSPHPKEVLASYDYRLSSAERKEPTREFQVTPLGRKIEIATSWNIDFLLRLKFDQSLSLLSPEEFVKLIILDALHASYIVVGYDFRFGHRGEGDARLLQKLGERFGFETEIVPPFMIEQERVSTSLVRAALLAADFERVEMLLGRPFEVTSRVQHGSKRGRLLSFPTLNLSFRSQLLPPDGVYAAIVILGQELKFAAVYVGRRPTFADANRRILEAHILEPGDYNLYGRRITVRFVRMIRSDRRFESPIELKRQIELDCKDVAGLFREKY